MIKKKFIATTPSRRFLNILQPIYKKSIANYFFTFLLVKPKQEYTKKKIKNKKGYRFLKKYKYIKLFTPIPGLQPYVCTSFFINPNNRIFLAFFKNFYNLSFILPKTSLMGIGRAYVITTSLLFNHIFFKHLNLFLPLSLIPVATVFSNIKSDNNSQAVYAKSSGSFCTRTRFLKNSKLEVVTLPSQRIKYFFKTTWGLLGVVTNCNLNKTIQGKFSSNLKKKYITNVRGVAQNPVDHPNGGRSKTKQPEKTPWGTIAKHNK